MREGGRGTCVLVHHLGELTSDKENGKQQQQQQQRNNSLSFLLHFADSVLAMLVLFCKVGPAVAAAARREASSGQLCSRPIATGPTAPLAHLRHNLGKIQPVINILVRSCPNLVMVGRGGKQDRTFDCRCAKSDGLSIYGTPLMGKLLIASIDFMSGKGCNKN